MCLRVRVRVVFVPVSVSGLHSRGYYPWDSSVPMLHKSHKQLQEEPPERKSQSKNWMKNPNAHSSKLNKWKNSKRQKKKKTAQCHHNLSGVNPLRETTR